MTPEMVVSSRILERPGPEPGWRTGWALANQLPHLCCRQRDVGDVWAGEGVTLGGQGELIGTQDLGRTNYSEGVRPTAHVHHQGVDGEIISQSHQEVWVLSNFSSVQLLSCVRLFVTPWMAARQASLSITYSWSPPKPMSIESVMPSNHLILCHILLLLPAIFPSIRVFSNESVLRIGDQSIGASASASVLSTNIQDWFPLGWIGWLSLLSKELSRVFSNTTVQKHQFFSIQLCL